MSKVKSILIEAEEIINGRRQSDYGPPENSFRMIARLWSAYLGINIRATDVAHLMMLLKIARNTQKYKRDNATDIAGYAGCLEKIEESKHNVVVDASKKAEV
jgi:hypothetical protein